MGVGAESNSVVMGGKQGDGTDTGGGLVTLGAETASPEALRAAQEDQGGVEPSRASGQGVASQHLIQISST